MASEFVRKVKGIRNIDILSPNITTENDLISTIDGEVYVATNKGYRKITGVETKEIKQLKTDVSNLKIQSDTNTLNISNLTDDIETNTSDIGTLQKDVETNTSYIGTLQKNVEINTSEIETLKTKINNYKVLLYDGSASNTGDVITLNQPYNDFTELKIKIKRIGGNEILNFDAEDGSAFSINITNIYNSNSEMELHEMNIDKNSSTELEITGQRSHTVISPTPRDDSGITILKIWGVK